MQPGKMRMHIQRLLNVPVRETLCELVLPLVLFIRRAVSLLSVRGFDERTGEDRSLRNIIPTTLVVQVQKSVRCVCVSVCPDNNF